MAIDQTATSGQVSLPKEIWKHLHIHHGEKLAVKAESGHAQSPSLVVHLFT